MSREALLFANEAFYRAFADADLPAMDALWMKEGPVACIHPGWQAITDRDLIIETWRRIFKGDEGKKESNNMEFTLHAPQAFLMGETGFVICYEVFSEGALVATNFFRRVGARWLIAHHQASPSPGYPKEAEDTDDLPVLPH